MVGKTAGASPRPTFMVYSIYKNSALLFTFGKNYGIIQLIDKPEFNKGVRWFEIKKYIEIG